MASLFYCPRRCLGLNVHAPITTVPAIVAFSGVIVIFRNSTEVGIRPITSKLLKIELYYL